MIERRSGITQVQGMAGVSEVYGLCQYEGRSYAATDKGLYDITGDVAMRVEPADGAQGLLDAAMQEFLRKNG